jgi:hypothetical protein
VGDRLDVELRVQLRTTGTRRATDVLWNVDGPADVEHFRLEDPGKESAPATRETGTMRTLTGEELPAHYITTTWPTASTSRTYERRLRFSCSSARAEQGIPLRVRVDADELYLGNDAGGASRRPRSVWEFWVMGRSPADIAAETSGK